MRQPSFARVTGSWRGGGGQSRPFRNRASEIDPWVAMPFRNISEVEITIN